MNDFFTQTNTPIVNVDRSARGYELTQHSANAKETTKRWNIPLAVFNVKTNETENVWLLSSGDVCGGSFSSANTYIFNRAGVAAARVRYTISAWARLLTDVNWKNVDEVTQLALIIDRLDEEREKKCVRLSCGRS